MVFNFSAYSNDVGFKVQKECNIFVHNKNSVIGHDGAYSIPFKPGFSLWTFGDTLTGKIVNDKREFNGFYRNSAAVVPFDIPIKNLCKNNITYLSDDNGIKPIIPFLADEDTKTIALWPMSGIEINGTVYFYYSIIKSQPTNDPMNSFTVMGTGLVKATEPFKTIDRVKTGDIKTIYFWEKDDIHFGIGAYKHKDGYIYIFGEKNFEKSEIKEHFKYCRLARVKPDFIEDINYYTYYSSKTDSWVKSAKDSTNIFYDTPGEMSISFNRYLNKFIAIYSEFLNNRIVMITADKITGPWSEPIKLYDCKYEEGILSYAAKEHPEYSQKNGKIIYITYCTNATIEKLINNTDLYWPHLISVEFI